jgi:hypothetical protein
MTDYIYTGNTIALGSTVKENGSALNISTATVKKIRVKYPSGTTEEFTADFQTNGSDGKIEIPEFEVTEEGVYVFQPYIEMGSFVGYGEAGSFVARRKI